MLALTSMLLTACAGSDGRPSSETSLYASVQGIDGVYFYPPLGPEPAADGPFEATLLDGISVTIEAAGADGTPIRLAAFDQGTRPAVALLAEHERYWVNIPAASYVTDPATTYTVRVLLDGTELGSSVLSPRIFDVLAWNPALPLGVQVRIEGSGAVRAVRAVRERQRGGTPAHCSDGVRNKDETGIDCGGGCPSCCVPTPEICANGLDDDCDGLVDEDCRRVGVPASALCTTTPVMPADMPTVREVGLDAHGVLLVLTEDELRRIDGPGRWTRLAPDLQWPYGMSVDEQGNVFLLHGIGGVEVVKVDPSGVVTHLAGSTEVTGYADGPGASALFDWADGLWADRHGNVFVADSGNAVVRRIDAAGDVTTVAGIPAPGSWGTGFADGPAAAARFGEIAAITGDNLGNLYVSDWDNALLRKISPDGLVSTLAGTLGTSGQDDGPAASAKIDSVWSLTFDGAGDLYFTDVASVRKLSGGVVSTVAGGANRGSDDGCPRLSTFPQLSSIAIAADGAIFVAGQRVRQLAGDQTCDCSACEFHVRVTADLRVDQAGATVRAPHRVFDATVPEGLWQSLPAQGGVRIDETFVLASNPPWAWPADAGGGYWAAIGFGCLVDLPASVSLAVGAPALAGYFPQPLASETFTYSSGEGSCLIGYTTAVEKFALCPPATCTNGVRDQGEDGVDCGGQCGACPTCSDGIQDQGETGVDCGGPCPVCETCSDGVQNQSERGIDDGGPCPLATCSDGVQNQGEVAVDCGGPCGTVTAEICGNGLDDDCDGLVDEACSTSQVFTASSGGTLRIEHGLLAGFALEVPPGALAADTTITVRLRDASPQATPLDPGADARLFVDLMQAFSEVVEGWSTVRGSDRMLLLQAAAVRSIGTGPTFELEPSGLRFAAPVSITLPYDPSVTLPMALRVGQWSSLEPTGRVMPNTVVDPVAHTITAEIQHFSAHQVVTALATLLAQLGGVPSATSPAQVAITAFLASLSPGNASQFITDPIAEHQGAEMAAQYLLETMLCKNGEAVPHQRPTTFPHHFAELMAHLSTMAPIFTPWYTQEEIDDLMSTGRERTLMRAILARPRSSFGEVFQDSLAANDGDLYGAALTMHNLLRAAGGRGLVPTASTAWSVADRAAISTIPARLAPLTDLDPRIDDTVGNYYHMAGLITLAVFDGNSFLSTLFGSLDEVVMSGLVSSNFEVSDFVANLIGSQAGGLLAADPSTRANLCGWPATYGTPVGIVRTQPAGDPWPLADFDDYWTRASAEAMRVEWRLGRSGAWTRLNHDVVRSNRSGHWHYWHAGTPGGFQIAPFVFLERGSRGTFVVEPFDVDNGVPAGVQQYRVTIRRAASGSVPELWYEGMRFTLDYDGWEGHEQNFQGPPVGNVYTSKPIEQAAGSMTIIEIPNDEPPSP